MNKTLEEVHPLIWPEIDRMDFMSKVSLLAKLLENLPVTGGRSRYDGALDAGRAEYGGLKELNKLRNDFSHYKAQEVEIYSPNDPYERLKKLPSIVKQLKALSKYGLSIPQV